MHKMLCLDWMQQEEEHLEAAGDVAEKQEMLRPAKGRGQGQHREAGCRPDSLYQLGSLGVMLRLQFTVTTGNTLWCSVLFRCSGNKKTSFQCGFALLSVPEVGIQRQGVMMTSTRLSTTACCTA